MNIEQTDVLIPHLATVATPTHTEKGKRETAEMKRRGAAIASATHGIDDLKQCTCGTIVIPCVCGDGKMSSNGFCEKMQFQHISLLQ